MKPIEPGCLAILLRADVRPELLGACVRVLRMASLANIHPNRIAEHGDRWWVLDLPATHGGLQPAQAEQYLLRIDGGEDESVTERHDEEVSA